MEVISISNDFHNKFESEGTESIYAEFNSEENQMFINSSEIFSIQLLELC